jgi:AcrR family transcriptional regulator
MAPNRVDKAERRRHITHAALQVFTSRGFKAAKMAEVAQAAGMGKGTLYEYFRSKDDLFLAVFVQVIDDMTDFALHEAENEGSAVDRHRRWRASLRHRRGRRGGHLGRFERRPALAELVRSQRPTHKARGALPRDLD